MSVMTSKGNGETSQDTPGWLKLQLTLPMNPKPQTISVVFPFRTNQNQESLSVIQPLDLPGLRSSSLGHCLIFSEIILISTFHRLQI